MADDPTIEEALSEVANALTSASRETHLTSFADIEEGNAPIPATIVLTAHLRTLLASHASLKTF